MFGTKEGESVSRCLFANRPCDRVAGKQSDVVFIAAPSANEYHFEVDAAKQVVADAKLRPEVAVHKHLLSLDVFCEKICTPIVESRFCIVILNGENPNVFYEYGLMRPLRKKVISLQRQDEKPPFNVEHLDTLRYSQPRLKDLLGDAVEAAAASTASHAKPSKRGRSRPASPFASQVSKLLELEGITESTETWLQEMAAGTAFRVLQNAHGPCFVAVLEAEWRLEEAVTDTLIVCRRLEREHSTLEGVLRVKREKQWRKHTQEHQARKEAIAHVRLLFATPDEVPDDAELALSRAIKSRGFSYPLPAVDVWTSGELTKRTRALTGGVEA